MPDVQINLENDLQTENHPIEQSNCIEINLESELSSENSMNEVPDFLSYSYESLHKMAGLSNQDQFIFSE